MSIPIDDETHRDEALISPEDTVVGNPGAPQKKYLSSDPLPIDDTNRDLPAMATMAARQTRFGPAVWLEGIWGHALRIGTTSYLVENLIRQSLQIYDWKRSLLGTPLGKSGTAS